MSKLIFQCSQGSLDLFSHATNAVLSFDSTSCHVDNAQSIMRNDSLLEPLQTYLDALAVLSQEVGPLSSFEMPVLVAIAHYCFNTI